MKFHDQNQQTNTHKPDYDNMEESLRNALRQNDHNSAISIGQLESPRHDREHNYVTVYNNMNGHSSDLPLTNHQQMKDESNMHNAGLHQSYVNGVDKQYETHSTPEVNMDDFRSYCLILNERVQKMEDQNSQLVRLAEKQKQEYNKVAAQVVHSEMIQRRLQTECLNLRKQVHHLTSHNQQLTENKVPTSQNKGKAVINTNPAMAPNVDSFSEAGGPYKNLHSSVHQQSSNDPLVDLLCRVQSHKQGKSALENGNTSDYKLDIANIVELYSKLQKLQSVQYAPQEVTFNHDLPNETIPLDIIPEQNDVNQKNSDTADYATPSNICATEGCLTCASNDTSKCKHNPSALHCKAEQKSKTALSNFQDKLKGERNSSGRGLERSQSFDNHSYHEVELKHFERNLNHQVNSPVSNFQRGNRMLRSHTHYSNVNTKPVLNQRPSSLVLDSEVATEMIEKCGEPSLTKISPTPKKQTNVFQNQTTQKQNSPEKSLEKQNKKSFLKKMSSPNTMSPPIGRKTHSRSSSVADLPPPPPPPPQSDYSQSGHLTELPTNDISNKNELLLDDTINECKKVPSLDIQTSVPSDIKTGKLSLWKPNNFKQSNENSPENISQKLLGWRRKSYTAACRKSQSLDHLYEHLLTENEKARRKGMEEINTANFNTLQLHQRTTSPSSPLERNRPNDNVSVTHTQEKKTLEDFPPLPPPHMLFGPMGSPQDHNSCGYASMASLEKSKVINKNISELPSNINHNLNQKNFSETNLPGHKKIDEPTISTTKSSEILLLQKNDQKSNHLRTRRMSEGSAIRRKTDRQNSEDNSKLPPRRHRSTSSDLSSNKRPEVAQRIDKIHPVGLNTPPQPRFPSTNPYVKSPVDSWNRQSSIGSSQNIFDKQFSFKSQSNSGKSLQSLKSFNSQSIELKASKFEEIKETIPKLANKTSKLPASKINSIAKPSDRGRSSSKSTPAPTKNKNSLSNDKKKETSGNKNSNHKTSFVNVMKAKFSRSSSGNRSSSSNKKNAQSSNKNKAKEIPQTTQVKSATSSIDPRTLSLEPNTYPPLRKDGGNKMASKKLLGNSSGLAVGRKLSQPYPKGTPQNPQETKLTNVVEEVVSDEGYAEGSTIERSDKIPGCTNVTSPYYDEVIVANNITCNLRDVQPQVNESTTHKKENTDWYDSVVSLNTKPEAKVADSLKENHNKRFQILPGHNLGASASKLQRPVKQKHTSARKQAIEREVPYENFPHIDQVAIENENPYENMAPCYSGINPDMPLNTNPNNWIKGADGDVFVTGVTIVRSSPPNTHFITQSNAKLPTNRQQRSTPPGKAIGRMFQNVSNHYSGSREDLKMKSVRGQSPNEGSSTTSSTGRADKEVLKINYAEHQKVFEKAFISSVVEAELVSKRNSLLDLQEQSGAQVPPSSTGNSVTEFVGTGSSFGSLPSDVIESNLSSDVIGYQGIASSGSSDHPATQTQRISKNKPNSSSSFGFSGRKMGTNSSNTSSSSSEISYRGRSRIPGSEQLSTPSAAKEISTPNQSRIGQRAKSVDPKNLLDREFKFPINSSGPALQSKRSQSGSRISKLSTPSKLPSPNSVKISPSSNTSPAGIPQVQKKKLAPLNHGHPPPSYITRPKAFLSNSSSEPIYENASVIRHSSQSSVEKGNSPISAQVPMRHSSPSFVRGIPTPTSKPPHPDISRNESRLTKRSFQSGAGILRPRPIYTGVEAV